MKFRGMYLMMIALVAAVMPLASTAMAQDSKDAQAELKARFEKRYPQVARMLDQGLVGETWQGNLELVRSDTKLDNDARKLLDDENADRKKLYELLAAKTADDGKKKLTAAQVGERNGRRKFQEAKPNWHLKAKEGNRWMQRSDVAVLKTDGTIGEKFDGSVAAVKPEHANDPQTQTVIVTENQIRKDIYRKQADDRKSTAEAEAEAAGKQNIADAKAGEYVMRKTGEWEKKR